MSQEPEKYVPDEGVVTRGVNVFDIVEDLADELDRIIDKSSAHTDLADNVRQFINALPKNNHGRAFPHGGMEGNRLMTSLMGAIREYAPEHLRFGVMPGRFFLVGYYSIMDPEADMDPDVLLELAIELINDAEDIDDIDQVIRTLELAKTKM